MNQLSEPASFVYHGMKIVVNPLCEDMPRMQVSPEFARLQSPQLVKETNEWMREFFGCAEVVFQSGGTIFMSDRAFNRLKNSTEATPWKS